MRNLLALMAVGVCAASAPAQTQIDTEYIMYGGIPGTTNWELRRTIDSNGNGVFTDGGEWATWAFDNEVLIAFVGDMRYQEVAGVPTVFGPGGSDNILRIVDNDGDGLALSAGEVNIFVDTRALYGVSNTSPDGVDFDLNGVLYVTDDIWSGAPQPGSGITAYNDIDGNGNAMGLGESTLFVDGQGALSVPGIIGNEPIDLGDFEAIMVDSNGVVIAWAQQDLVHYAFQDMNGDGDAMDPGEARNFLNLIGDKANLEQNPDVAAFLLPNPSCPSTGGVGRYGSLEAMAVEHGGGPNGEDIYWIASTASNSSCNGGNGYVFRGIDNNGDGDLNDAGEVTLWLDGANNAFMLYPVTSIWDGDANDGGFTIFQGSGPFGINFEQDSVYWLEDLNGDGDAMDNNEQQLRYFWEPDGAFTDGICAVPFTAFNPDLPFCEIFGSPGTTSTGSQPLINHVGVPDLGGQFDVTLTGATIAASPTTTAFLRIGASDTFWNRFGGLGLPLDLTPYGAAGNILYVSDEYGDFPTNVLSTGDALLTLQVPGNPAAKGADFFCQWAVTDPTANTRGITVSDALHCQIQ